MTTGRVEDLLRAYKSNQCRIKQLQAKAEALTAQIEYETAQHYAAQTLGAQQYDCMPRGTATTDPTATNACMRADLVLPSEIHAMQRERQRLEVTIANIQVSVTYVDAWLESLNERDRYIVRQKTVEGVSWRDLEVEFERDWGHHLCLSSLRRAYHRHIVYMTTISPIKCQFEQELSKK